MTLKAIYDLINNLITLNGNTFFIIILVLLSIIQISPLKLNPWTWLSKKISSAIVGTMAEQINKIDESITDVYAGMQEIKADIDLLSSGQQDLKENIERQEAVTARTRILRMNNDLLLGIKHTKESFDQSLEDIKNYNKYCKDNPNFENEKTILSAQNIEDTYKKCLREHSFLGYN